MKWLSVAMVHALHRESLAYFGGADGVRDDGLLDSALARPQNVHVYEPDADAFRLAASYCHGIVKNHPFVDGNKRTGILAAVSFLAVNSIHVAFDEAEVAAVVIGVAAGDVSASELADWLRRSAA